MNIVKSRRPRDAKNWGRPRLLRWSHPVTVERRDRAGTGLRSCRGDSPCSASQACTGCERPHGGVDQDLRDDPAWAIPPSVWSCSGSAAVRVAIAWSLNIVGRASPSVGDVVPGAYVWLVAQGRGMVQIIWLSPPETMRSWRSTCLSTRPVPPLCTTDPSRTDLLATSSRPRPSTPGSDRARCSR